MNLADTNGMTPLMHAVKTNDVKMVLRLLDKDGGLPLEGATEEMLPLDKILHKGSLVVTSGVNVGAQAWHTVRTRRKYENLSLGNNNKDAGAK